MMITLVIMLGIITLAWLALHYINKMDLRASLDEEKKRTHEIQMQQFIRYPNR